MQELVEDRINLVLLLKLMPKQKNMVKLAVKHYVYKYHPVSYIGRLEAKYLTINF